MLDRKLRYLGPDELELEQAVEAALLRYCQKKQLRPVEISVSLFLHLSSAELTASATIER